MMNKQLIINLDFLPISVNLAYCFNRRNGKCYKSKKCKEREVEWKNGLQPYTDQKMCGFVKIEFIFTKKRKGKWDCDNLVKFTQDMLMNCGIIDDDSNIISFSARKKQGTSDHTLIIIKQWEDDDAVETKE